MPHCGTILVVWRRDGKALEVRKPLLEESTGDRFEDAFLKVKKRPKEVDERITAAKQKENERLRGADDFFRQALARARESDDKTVNPLDQDQWAVRSETPGSFSAKRGV